MIRSRSIVRITFLASLACAVLAGTGDVVPRAHAAESAPQAAQRAPRIQVAILLDTSNSMDGLIDQARNQLWQVVDAFSSARRGGVTPRLEVAVLEYGNAGLSEQSGFVRQVAGLTTDLDRVSEALFGLATNGGDEYCGYAIDVATRQLQWSTEKGDIRAIFIAGNEPFTQGPVSFVSAIERAKQRGIVVHTLHAGPQDEGLATHWLTGAQLAGGHFMSIDPNLKTVHIEAPQDRRLAELNTELNDTYVPYGAAGQPAKERQAAQDANSAAISGALLAKRAKTKATAFYESSSWDLVDALEQKTVKLENVKDEDLPEALRTLAPAERASAIERKSKERKDLQAQIVALGAERDAYVAEQRREHPRDEAKSLDGALIEAVIAQGKRNGFDFDPNDPQP
jgi:hypothetical protein